jgi:hypothetical protein
MSALVLDGDVIAIRWRHARDRSLGWCALGFAAVLGWLALRHGVFEGVHRALMALAAAGLVYFAAVQQLNATRLRVRDGILEVEHGPLPWRGGLALPVEAVARLAVDRASHRLELRTRDGQELVLCEALPPEAADRFAELAGALGLQRRRETP